ncbi:MAG: hypothetical protein K9N51_09700, partial [Candidatus Pacebacteria bacterium]|nr:hypothetical protein [Candidatus Paceibacterota bacterium]
GLMKVTYVGAGAFGVLGQARELLAHATLAIDLEIALYDLNIERAHAMRTMIRRAPEFAGSNARITCTHGLDRALDGADFVQLTACPWRHANNRRSTELCYWYGWIGSDNVSPNGAFCSLRSATLALDVARRMERCSPTGTLIVFTNPIPVLTAAVNRHTRIRAVGICGGQRNYIHNIAHMMGWHDLNWGLDAEVAGINHFSWIMSLTLDGEDFLPRLDARWREGLDWDHIDTIGNADVLRRTFPRERYAGETFGAILYSCEYDGLPHLCFYDEEVMRLRPAVKPPIAPEDARGDPGRRSGKNFITMATSDLPPDFWTYDHRRAKAWDREPYPAQVATRMIRGLVGDMPRERVTTSYLNQGAVAGFPDDVVLEYSTVFSSDGISHDRTYTLPPATVGVSRALAEFQTLTADAIAESDRRKFLQAIYAYPMCRDCRKVEAFVKEMCVINNDELPAFMK